MKKNRKKYNLNDLSSLMNSVNPQEQATTIGGYDYYDYQGNYMGSNGAECGIRVIDSRTSIYSSEASTAAFFASVSDETKRAIVNTIAQNNGIMGEIHFTYNSNQSLGGQCVGGEIYFNMNSKFVQGGNPYDIALILAHEQYHSNQRYGDPVTYLNASEAEREYAAYLHVYYNPDFWRASGDFQRLIENGINVYGQQLGIY